MSLWLAEQPSRAVLVPSAQTCASAGFLSLTHQSASAAARFHALLALRVLWLLLPAFRPARSARSLSREALVPRSHPESRFRRRRLPYPEPALLALRRKLLVPADLKVLALLPKAHRIARFRQPAPDRPAGRRSQNPRLAKLSVDQQMTCQ